MREASQAYWSSTSKFALFCAILFFPCHSIPSPIAGFIHYSWCFQQWSLLKLLEFDHSPPSPPIPCGLVPLGQLCWFVVAQLPLDKAYQLTPSYFQVVFNIERSKGTIRNTRAYRSSSLKTPEGTCNWSRCRGTTRCSCLRSNRESGHRGSWRKEKTVSLRYETEGRLGNKAIK